MPSGSPDTPGLSLPAGTPAGDAAEVFLLLPGLNLRPARLAPWRALLLAHGLAVLEPPLAGMTPADPAAWRQVSARRWVAELDAAWAGVQAQLPGAVPSLFGFSLGALLGAVWAHESGRTPARAVLLSPAFSVPLRLRPVLAAISLLPGPLCLPSRSPHAYRNHPCTSAAAYRALRVLLRRAARERVVPALAARGAPWFMACHPWDELVRYAPLEALAQGQPAVTLHTLAHGRQWAFPRHLGVDVATLGEAEYTRLHTALDDWLQGHRPAVRREPA